MKIKEGVSLQGLHLEMRDVIVAADRIWHDYGRELVITSGTESTDAHWAGSLHFYGYALDLRTHYFNPGDKKEIAETLQATLGNNYKVIAETTHIHAHFKAIPD
jgi:hypothetical protein